MAIMSRFNAFIFARTKMSDELILIQNLIYEVRGKRVMLDFDLARLYNVETRVLNQAVKRNIKRFPIVFGECRESVFVAD